ncbi:3145_t:CDS:2, partial [Dentiscutata erythropus]
KMNKWYYNLVSEEYETHIRRTIIHRDNKSIIVREISHELEVLDLHKVLTPVITRDSGQDNICFKMCFSKYNWSGNRSSLWYLGLSDENNIQFLQETVTQKYPNLFNHYSQTIKAFNTEKTLKNSLTRMKYQLKTVMETEETPIRKGIVLNKSGKYLTPQETQALIVEYNTIKNELKNAKKTITRLKEKITRLTSLPDQDIDSSHDEIVRTTIDDLIEEWKLGSTLLVDTKTYLSLVLEKPCNNCGNYLISKRDCQLIVIGFKAKCFIRCKECETIIEISNEKKDICFSKAVAAGGLGAGITRHAVQSFLATIGITSQCSKAIYHNHQHQLFSKIIELAKSSTNNAIINCIDHVEQALTEQANSTKSELDEHKKILPISFDVSWSHGRNAKQASGEFICHLEFEAVIRSNDQERKEIRYEVRQRHDTNGTVFDDMANLIREVADDAKKAFPDSF